MASVPIPAGASPDFLKQYAVFGTYGYAMLQVQLFERALALTLLAVDHAAAYERRTEAQLTQPAFRRRMEKSP